MFISSWPDCRFRIHYLLMAVLLVSASFLLLLGIWPTYPIQESDTVGLLPIFFGFIGLFHIVGGIFDHLLLVRP